MQALADPTGKVLRSTRNKYIVMYGDSSIVCTVRGKLAGAPNAPILSVKVGDDVLVERVSEDEGVITEILPRRSRLSRAVEGKAYREHIIATNIDQLLIIMSTSQPEFKSGLLDRYIVIAEKNRLHSVVCINKVDLKNEQEFFPYQEWYSGLGYPVFFTSAKSGYGLDELRSTLKDKVSALVGHSGVGKSALIKRLEPGLDLKIAEISNKTRKGRHTTTFSQLFPLGFGGYVIDTPGVRELGLWDIYRHQLKEFFVEFRAFEPHCQFNDCMHLREPGCAVKTAVEDGRIFGERYQNYQNIHSDLRAAHYELIKRR